MSVGGVSGGAFNPAVAMLTLVRLMDSTDLAAGASAEGSLFLATIRSDTWIHLAGPMAGGLLAGLLFRITHPSQVGDGSALLKSWREALAPYLIEATGTTQVRLVPVTLTLTLQP